MRVSIVLAVAFAAFTSATSLPRVATNDLEARLFDAAKFNKRCICCCNESSCSGPACCANGSCGGGDADQCCL